MGGSNSSAVTELRERVSKYDKQVERLQIRNEVQGNENRQLKEEVKSLNRRVDSLVIGLNQFQNEQRKDREDQFTHLVKIINDYDAYPQSAYNRLTQEKVLKPLDIRYNSFQLSQTFYSGVHRQPYF